MNLIDNFAVDKIEIKETEKEKYKIEEKNQVIVEGNSYNLILNKQINFDGRTAGFFMIILIIRNLNSIFFYKMD